MKLLLFLAWREIKLRWRSLLPFVLTAAAVVFTSVSLVTFQESANSDDDFVYMLTPSYMIMLSAFALIGFVSARTFFRLHGENQLGETGTLRALGLKKRDIRRIRLILGFICIGTASIIALPLALLYIYAFVNSCNSVDMELTTVSSGHIAGSSPQMH